MRYTCIVTFIFSFIALTNSNRAQYLSSEYLDHLYINPKPNKEHHIDSFDIEMTQYQADEMDGSALADTLILNSFLDRYLLNNDGYITYMRSIAGADQPYQQIWKILDNQTSVYVIDFNTSKVNKKTIETFDQQNRKIGIYDKTGLALERTLYNKNNRVTYKYYHSKGRLDSVLKIKPEDDSYIFRYSYHPNGNINEVLGYQRFDDMEKLDLIYIYEYDDRQLPVKVTLSYAEVDELWIEYLFKYHQ